MVHAIVIAEFAVPLWSVTSVQPKHFQPFRGEDIIVSKPTSVAILVPSQVKEVAWRWLLFMQRVKKEGGYRTVSSGTTNISQSSTGD